MKSRENENGKSRVVVKEILGDEPWTELPYRKPALEDRGTLRPRLLAGSVPPAPP